MSSARDCSREDTFFIIRVKSSFDHSKSIEEPRFWVDFSSSIRSSSRPRVPLWRFDRRDLIDFMSKSKPPAKSGVSKAKPTKGTTSKSAPKPSDDFVPLLPPGVTARRFEDLPELDEPLDALVIAPHPDDAELGMGGTIAKLMEQGWNVGIVDLTSGEPTPNGSPAIRREETRAATQHLGVRWRYNMGWINRKLEATLELRHELASLFRLTQPRWLFAPYWEDAHPDHLAATQIVEAARFWSKLTKCDLLGAPFHPQRVFHYYCIHLKLAIHPSFIVDITQQWPKKERSIRAYESQFVVGRSVEPPTLLDRFRDEAAYWGKSIGTAYGEPFAAREPIGLSGLSELL